MMIIRYIIFAVSLLTMAPSGIFAQAAIERPVNRPNHQLESQFLATNLSAAQFQAFEERAVQKLVDFGDYLEIIGNNTYEKSLREHASELIYGLFVSAQVPVGSMGTLSQMVTSRLRGKSQAGQVYVEEVSVSQPLRLRENQFSGELSFMLKSGETRTPHTAEITLRQTTKKFGSEMIGVWEVFLGEIQMKNSK
ncbi:MAG: hypothetical protein R3D00_20020 [Bacteroidia bacterium]